MKLSRYFMLDEMLRTTRDVDGDPSTPYTVDNAAPAQALQNMKVLAMFNMDRIRERWGETIVTSGFRNAKLNKMVGGAKGSAHLYGCAADLVFKHATVEQVWLWLPTSGLQYDQAIWEIGRNGSQWLHYGIARPGTKGPRLMHFKQDMR